MPLPISRRSRGSEEQSPCFWWVECKFVFLFSSKPIFSAQDRNTACQNTFSYCDPEQGSSPARCAKSVTDCTQKMRRLTGIPCHASEEGCSIMSQMYCRANLGQSSQIPLLQRPALHNDLIIGAILKCLLQFAELFCSCCPCHVVGSGDHTWVTGSLQLLLL